MEQYRLLPCDEACIATRALYTVVNRALRRGTTQGDVNAAVCHANLVKCREDPGRPMCPRLSAFMGAVSVPEPRMPDELKDEIRQD